MEFHEKLRELRTQRGLTQEELAGALFVSRTAVSKWEAGRGYPSIDSLREISKYFSVTIDELLSGENLLSIAEQENRSNLQTLRGLLFGMLDLFSFALILLPLYPKPVDGYVYSVNLPAYTDTTFLNRLIHWLLFLSLIVTGVVNILLTRFQMEKRSKFMTGVSMGLGILAVLFLAMTREAYAIAAAFLLFTAKGILLFQSVKAGNGFTVRQSKQ